MENFRPIISIICPAFNSARYLSGAIDSVLKQTYKKWEMVIVDDGSEDDTLTICKEITPHRTANLSS